MNKPLWVRDKHHVGFKLLQKMGWSEGRGLGANEDGMQEAIKVRPKNDAKGVGFHDDSDNNWLEHQFEFNALLSRLNENNAEPSPKMISLEEKSKSSRSRLHYHKYTRGKDLSNCSDKDLACILGKQKTVTHEDTDLDNNNITSKMSTQEYFLQKRGLLEANKEVYENLPAVSSLLQQEKLASFSESVSKEWDHLQTEECILKKKKHKRKKESFQDFKEDFLEVNQKDCNNLQADECSSKKKKHKKRKDVTAFSDSQVGLLDTSKQECDPLLTVHPPVKKNQKQKKEASFHDSKEGELRIKKRKRQQESCNEEGDTYVNLGSNEKSDKKKLKQTKVWINTDESKTSIDDQVNADRFKLSKLELKSNTDKKFKLKKVDVEIENGKNDSAKDTTWDELATCKREFVIGLLTTFRHPSANLPDLFVDVMKMDLFNGSNFFSIKGYGPEWL